MNEIFTARGSVLIAGVTVDGATVDIAVDETGAIAAIGKDARKTIDAEIIIDGSDRVAVPGLVNTHTHAAMSLLRGYADDMILQDWLSQKIWPLEAHLTGDDVYAGTRLACLEMIKSGTVAFNDICFFMDRAAAAMTRWACGRRSPTGSSTSGWRRSGRPRSKRRRPSSPT